MPPRSPLGDSLARQRELFASVPYEDGKGVPVVNQEEEELTSDGLINTAALLARVGLPTVGGFLGPIGGAAGGALGEGTAQLLERISGQREEFNPKSIAVETALGAIPMGKLAKLSRLRRMGLESARGAGIGGSASVAHQLAAEGEVDPGRAALDALLGGAMGGSIAGLATRGSLRGGQQGYTNLPADYAGKAVLEELGGEAGFLKTSELLGAKTKQKIAQIVEGTLFDESKFTPGFLNTLKKNIRGILEEDLEVSSKQQAKLIDLIENLDPKKPADIITLQEALNAWHIESPPTAARRRMEGLDDELEDFDDVPIDPTVRSTKPEDVAREPLSINVLASDEMGDAGIYWPGGRVIQDENAAQTVAKRAMQAASVTIGGKGYKLIPPDMPFLHQYTKSRNSPGIFPRTLLRPQAAPKFLKNTRGQDWVTTGIDMRSMDEPIKIRQTAEPNLSQKQADALARSKAERTRGRSSDVGPTLDEPTPGTQPLPVKPEASRPTLYEEIQEFQALRDKKVVQISQHKIDLPDQPFDALTNYNVSLGKETLDNGKPIHFLSIMDEWGFNPKTSKGMGPVAKALRLPPLKQLLDESVGRSFVVYERIPVKIKEVTQVLKKSGRTVQNFELRYDHAGAAQLARAGQGNKGWNGVRNWDEISSSNLETRLKELDTSNTDGLPNLHALLLDGMHRGGESAKEPALINTVVNYLEGIDRNSDVTTHLLRDFVPAGERTAIKKYVDTFRRFYKDQDIQAGERFSPSKFWGFIKGEEGPDILLPPQMRELRDPTPAISFREAETGLAHNPVEPEFYRWQ